MLEVLGKGKVVHRKPLELLPPTALEALQALTILSGWVHTHGSVSEKIAYKTVEKHLRAACPIEKGVA